VKAAASVTELANFGKTSLRSSDSLVPLRNPSQGYPENSEICEFRTVRARAVAE
jgi:hypothetical protein